MRWEDERYVLLYTRDTAEWIALSWEARAVFVEILRKVDRAGILRLGKTGTKGLAGLIRVPLEVVEPALAELVADGCVQVSEASVVVPNFLAAQETPRSDAARKRMARERARDLAVTFCDTESRNVTSGHVLGPGVTPGHTTSQSGHTTAHEVTPSLPVPSLPVPSRPVPCADAGGREREPPRRSDPPQAADTHTHPPEGGGREPRRLPAGAPGGAQDAPRVANGAHDVATGSPGASDGRVGHSVVARTSSDPGVERVREALRGQPRLWDLGNDPSFAETLIGRAAAKGTKLEWLEAAIADAAADTPPGELVQARQKRVRAYCDRARAPNVDGSAARTLPTRFRKGPPVQPPSDAACAQPGRHNAELAEGVAELRRRREEGWVWDGKLGMEVLRPKPPGETESNQQQEPKA